MAQGLFTPDPSLWPYTPLYKDRSRNNYTLHAPSGSPDGVVHHYTIVPSLGLHIGPACEADLSAGMRRERVPPQRRKKERKRDLIQFSIDETKSF